MELDRKRNRPGTENPHNVQRPPHFFPAFIEPAPRHSDEFIQHLNRRHSSRGQQLFRHLTAVVTLTKSVKDDVGI